MTLKQRALEWYEGLPPKIKQKTLLWGSLGSAVVVLWIATQMSGNEIPKPPPKTTTSDSYVMDEDLMQETLREDVLKENQELRSKIDELEERFAQFTNNTGRALSDVKADLEASKNSLPANTSGTDIPSIAPSNELASMVVPHSASFPPPPGNQATAGDTSNGENLEPITVEIIGGIDGVDPIVSAPGTEKKSQQKIYLPVGFMRATLLTGLDAMVGNDAQNNPEPVMARVQAPAVLPNHVKANLEGCFVIGNGIGVLAKERIEVRAVSLSCVDFENRSVIDERIKGYFVDMDGKKGLSGGVVTRNGAIVGRSFAAGMLDGFGSVAELSSGTQSVSPLGTTRTFDAEEAAVAGLGRGVSSTSESLRDYYLDMAKSITPIIEVGPGKEFILVLQEGVTLNIKEVDDVIQN